MNLSIIIFKKVLQIKLGSIRNNDAILVVYLVFHHSTGGPEVKFSSIDSSLSGVYFFHMWILQWVFYIHFFTAIVLPDLSWKRMIEMIRQVCVL